MSIFLVVQDLMARAVHFLWQETAVVHSGEVVDAPDLVVACRDMHMEPGEAVLMTEH